MPKPRDILRHTDSVKAPPEKTQTPPPRQTIRTISTIREGHAIYSQIMQKHDQAKTRHV